MEQPSQHLHEKYRKKKQTDQFLTPVQEILRVRGKVFYHESAQAHSLIRLTKEVLSHYPQLRKKVHLSRISWSYLARLTK